MERALLEKVRRIFENEFVGPIFGRSSIIDIQHTLRPISPTFHHTVFAITMGFECETFTNAFRLS